jgi:hypothetical protein
MKRECIPGTHRQNNNPFSGSTRHLPVNEARTQNPSGKLLTTVFWDLEGILPIEYMEKGFTITEEKSTRKQSES